MALRLDDDGDCLDCGTPDDPHPGGVHTAESCLMPGCDCNPAKPPPPQSTSMAESPAFRLGAIEALETIELWLVSGSGRINRGSLLGYLADLRRLYGDVRPRDPEYTHDDDDERKRP